jgi:hypothetical protein
MKLKTSELEGEMLNRAVAKCEGIKGFDAENCCFYDDEGMPFEPSCVWAQGGPIIERERLKVVYFASSQEWNVSKLRYGGLCEPHDMKGPSLLVAAMRCYVASKLGDEVEIPEEVTK